jgi:hypothetical protein
MEDISFGDFYIFFMKIRLLKANSAVQHICIQHKISTMPLKHIKLLVRSLEKACDIMDKLVEDDSVLEQD